MLELPTVEECQAFHAKVNEGRVAFGLEPLDKLDFLRATPNDGSNCLSARNLFLVDDPQAYVWSDHVNLPDRRTDALSAIDWTVYGDGVLIPEEILRVTNYFDRCTSGDERHVALRDRLREAGVIA